MVFSCHIRPVVVCWSVVGYGDCFRVIVPCKQQVVRDGVKNFAESIRKAFTDGFCKVLLKGVGGTPSWLPNQMISFSIPRWPRNIAQQCARVPPKFVHLFLREIKIRHQRLGESPNLQKKSSNDSVSGVKSCVCGEFCLFKNSATTFLAPSLSKRGSNQHKRTLIFSTASGALVVGGVSDIYIYVVVSNPSGDSLWAF